jgi:hypothetical protein
VVIRRYQGMQLILNTKTSSNGLKTLSRLIKNNLKLMEKFELYKEQLLEAIENEYSEDLIEILRRRCLQALEDIIKNDYNI